MVILVTLADFEALVYHLKEFDRRIPRQNLDSLSTQAPSSFGAWVEELNDWRPIDLAGYRNPQDWIIYINFGKEVVDYLSSVKVKA